MPDRPLLQSSCEHVDSIGVCVLILDCRRACLSAWDARLALSATSWGLKTARVAPRTRSPMTRPSAPAIAGLSARSGSSGLLIIRAFIADTTDPCRLASCRAKFVRRAQFAHPAESQQTLLKPRLAGLLLAVSLRPMCVLNRWREPNTTTFYRCLRVGHW